MSTVWSWLKRYKPWTKLVDKWERTYSERKGNEHAIVQWFAKRYSLTDRVDNGVCSEHYNSEMNWNGSIAEFDFGDSLQMGVLLRFFWEQNLKDFEFFFLFVCGVRQVRSDRRLWGGVGHTCMSTMSCDFDTCPYEVPLVFENVNVKYAKMLLLTFSSLNIRIDCGLWLIVRARCISFESTSFSCLRIW